MIFPKAEIKGIQNLHRALAAETARQRKAVNNAVRIEGFRLRGLLKKELASGKPGGQQLIPLREIGTVQTGEMRNIRRPASGRRPKTRPLANLRHGIFYDIKPGHDFQIAVGWVGSQSSTTMKRLATIHQEGFKGGMKDNVRRFLAKEGVALPEKSRKRKYYFIRKETKTFVTPARPIMVPFWAKYRAISWNNIRNNYARKLRGEYI
jgi:hypothetical protein